MIIVLIHIPVAKYPKPEMGDGGYQKMEEAAIASSRARLRLEPNLLPWAPAHTVQSWRVTPSI